MTKLRIFISSPGDVSEERALSVRVFERLGREFSEAVQLEVVLWEHEPLFGHVHFQAQIERPSQCDLVVCILWSRLGTRLPSNYVLAPGEAPPTGTEFEVRDALAAYQRLGKPNLLIYRRTAPPQVNLASSDARERLRQYEMLEDFCRRAFYNEQGEVLVAHRSYAEAYEFEKLLTEHVRRWLERQVGESVSRPRWTLGSPYRGLEVFEAEHREIYFGRSEAVGELTKRMREAESRASSGQQIVRFLLVQGMSGNGKSSLVRAGLLPLLEGRALEGIGLWRQVTCKPSDRSAKYAEVGVLGALAESLMQALPTLSESYPDTEQLSERLRSAPAESAARLDGYLAQEAIRAGLKPNQIRLVVFIDQLEELFATSLAAPERAAFIGVLWALSREGRIWVIATLRSDFASRLEEQAELVSLTGEGQVYLLGPPQPDELADMIREPALAAGLQWESREGVSLDQAILREATGSPESLPLLEYALDRLYEEGRNGRLLTYASYEKLGGLQGGISATAEAVLTAQDYAPDAFAPLMRSLVSVDETGTATRRYALLTEFPDNSPERKLLDALIERRLCVTDRRREPVVSFAHEALIQSWPRAVEWLSREGELLAVRDRVTRDADMWDKRGRPKGLLGVAPERLHDIRRLTHALNELPASLSEYVHATETQALKLKRYRLAAATALIAVSLLATTAALYASNQRDTATHKQASLLAQISLVDLEQGNIDKAMSGAKRAVQTWTDSRGQPDPEAAFALKRADLIRPVPIDSRLSAYRIIKVLGWTKGERFGAGYALLSGEGSAIFLSPKFHILANIHPPTGIAVDAMSSDHKFGIVGSDSDLITTTTTTDGVISVPNTFGTGTWPSQSLDHACEGSKCAYVFKDQTIQVITVGQQKSTLFHINDGPAVSQITWLGPDRVAVMRQGTLQIYKLPENWEANNGAAAMLESSLDAHAIEMQGWGSDKIYFINESLQLALWHGSSVRESVLTKLSAPLLSLSISGQDGSAIAVATDGSITVADGSHIFRVPSTWPSVWRVYELHDTRNLVILDASGLASIVDYTDGTVLLRWRASRGVVRSSTFDAANDCLITISDAGDVYAWALSGLRPRDAAKKHTITPSIIQRTISVDSPSTMRDFPLETIVEGKSPHRIATEGREMQEGAFRLLAGSDDRQVALLDVNGTVAALSADGRLFALTPSQKFVSATESSLTHTFAFNLTDRIAIVDRSSLGTESGQVRLVTLVDRAHRGNHISIGAVQYNRDGQLLAVTDRWAVVLDKSLRILAASNVTADLSATHTEVRDFWLSPDETELIIRVAPCRYHSFDLGSRKEILSIQTRCDGA